MNPPPEANPRLAQLRRTRAQVTAFLAEHPSLRLALSLYGLATVYEALVALLARPRRRPVLFSRSSLRLAAFVSAYGALYRLALARLRAIIPNAKKYLPPFLAALIAASSMLLEPRGPRRVALACYALTRAVQGVWDAAVLNGRVPAPFVEGRWWFGGHLLFAASNAVLLHAFVYFPQTFPRPYANFILKYSTSYLPSKPTSYPATYSWPTPRTLVSHIALASSPPTSWPPFISPVLHPISAPSPSPVLAPILLGAHPCHTYLTCAFLHPADPACSNVFRQFLAKEFRSALPFFAAISGLSLLLKPRALLANPEGTLSKLFISTLSSSAFLSLSLSTAWSTICLFQHILPRRVLPTSRFYLQGFLAGLWVFLVDLPSSLPGYRATELGMYTARMALQTAWEVLNLQRLRKGKRGINIPHGEVAVFALSTAVLMALFEVKPQAIRSGLIRAALKQVVMRPSTSSDEVEYEKKAREGEPAVAEEGKVLSE